LQLAILHTMDIHFLITTFSYVAIFVLMIGNGIINIPSSQILYLVVGYFIGNGTLLFLPALLAGVLGNTVGNVVTFLLVKKYDKAFAKKIVMLDEATFEKMHRALSKTFSKHGMWWILVGKCTPSVKAFIPILAGLAKTPTLLTSIIFFIASGVWATLIISIGFFFGEHASLTSLGAVSLLVGGIIFFFIYKTYRDQFSK
jgi:membrane-associated protein